MVNKEKMQELDSHWKEVLKLAADYGFTCLEFGGAAILVTHKAQHEMWGDDKYIEKQLDMHHIDVDEADP